jgi:hypothetical protein
MIRQQIDGRAENKPSPRLRFGGDVTDGDVDLGYLQTG